jgi:hypothetical protein
VIEDTPLQEFALEPLLHRCSPPFFALKTGSCTRQICPSPWPVLQGLVSAAIMAA